MVGRRVRPPGSDAGRQALNGKRRSGSDKKPSGTLAKLALIAVAVALGATAYTRLSDQAQRILVGIFCALGAVGTIVMLVILIRQSDGSR